MDGFWEVISLTYNNGEPIPDERRERRRSEAFVADDGTQICGAFVSHEMNASRGDAVLSCGGVAGVGVLPHIRKGGVGRSMMNWFVRYQHERQRDLASLYAFRETFYRKSGYEVAGKRLKITCPTHRLPNVESSLPVTRITPDSWAELVPCYSAFARTRSGVHLRNEAMWARVLNESKPSTIYAFGDPIEAYIALSHKVDFWVEQHISEFVWSTQRGYEAGLSYLAQLGINKTAITWYEPSDGPFYQMYLDQGIEAKVDRPIMFRVCDVPGALRKLGSEEFGEFSFGVIDPVIPENEGPWRVRFTLDGVEVEKTTHADFELTTQAFTQAFLGEPSLSSLALNGAVTVHESNGLKAASRLLSPMSAYCMDFF